MHDLPDAIKLPKVSTVVFGDTTYITYADHLAAQSELSDAIWEKAYKLCNTGMTVGMIRRWVWNYWQVPKGREKA